MSEGSRALLVEDDDGRAVALGDILSRSRKSDWSLDVARSVKEGRQRLQAQHYDALLLDVGVADAGGTSEVSGLCEDFPQTALIVLMRASDDVVAGEVIRLGAVDVLTYDEMDPQTVARALRQGTARRALMRGLRQSQVNLARSQKGLAEAQRVGRVGSWEWDFDTRKIEWSDEHYRIFGMVPRPGGLDADEAIARVHPDDLERMRELVAATLRDGGDYATYVRIVRPDGSVRTILSRGAVVPEAGRRRRMVGVALDVTELRETATERDALLKEARESQRAMQALARRLVDVQEAERREIARELHDEAGQVLAGLKLLLESKELGEPCVHNEELRATVDTLMDHIRGLSIRLRPPMLDDLGIGPTLAWHVKRLATLTGLEVHLTSGEGVDRRFDAAVELTAYRLVQEALTNVARHSGANRATVEIWTDASKLYLRVSDSGRGFLPANASTEESLGLVGMRERCTAVGGRLEVDSSPGHGTTVLAALPMDGPGPS